MGTYSEYPTEIPPISDGDLKLLRKLKLSMFAMLVVVIVHSAAAKFPELYPLTRWAMYSQAKEGPLELRQGYLLTYEVVVTYKDGEVHTFTNNDFYAGLKLTSARSNLAALAMVNAVDPEDPTVQEEYMSGLFERAETLEGVPAQRIEVYRKGHLIDYDNFPPVDFDRTDVRDLMGVLVRDAEGKIREIEE